MKHLINPNNYLYDRINENDETGNEPDSNSSSPFGYKFGDETDLENLSAHQKYFLGVIEQVMKDLDRAVIRQLSTREKCCLIDAVRRIVQTPYDSYMLWYRTTVGDAWIFKDENDIERTELMAVKQIIDQQKQSQDYDIQ